MFLIRQARPRDHRRLLRLARELNSINLPTGSGELAEALARSEGSFAGRIRNRSRALYIFCADDLDAAGVIGTSMIIAKHGTPQFPHYYLQVETEDRYSRTLGKMFKHTFLRLRCSMDGPTELGGLVVDPKMRRRSERPGKQISWVRFLYIARHLPRFESRIIAEMLAPVLPDGKNPFWEHYGGPVTGLTFRQADRLSIRDKEFISALFPESPLYTFLLPDDVRSALGMVGDQTRGAVLLVQQAGMSFLGHLDPFDAGPYYGAPTAELIPVRNFYSRSAVRGQVRAEAVKRLLMVGCDDRQRGFRAIVIPQDNAGADEVALPQEAFQALQIKEGARLGVIELP